MWAVYADLFRRSVDCPGPCGVASKVGRCGIGRFWGCIAVSRKRRQELLLIDERSVATQGRCERGAERCLETWFSAAVGHFPRAAFPPERCGETSPQDKPERSHETCGTMSPNQTPPGHNCVVSRHRSYGVSRFSVFEVPRGGVISGVRSGCGGEIPAGFGGQLVAPRHFGVASEVG